MVSNFHNYVVAVLCHKGGADAVEYALIMALVAVFIIAGILALSGEMGELFNKMAECLDDPALCTPDVFREICTDAHENCGTG